MVQIDDMWKNRANVATKSRTEGGGCFEKKESLGTLEDEARIAREEAEKK